MIHFDVLNRHVGVAQINNDDPLKTFCITSDIRITANCADELDSFLAMILSSAEVFNGGNVPAHLATKYGPGTVHIFGGNSSSSSESEENEQNIEDDCDNSVDTEESSEDWDPMVDIEIP